MNRNLKIASAEEIIFSRIYVRKHKVMFDFDLDSLYEVETKVLNQAVADFAPVPFDVQQKLTKGMKVAEMELA